MFYKIGVLKNFVKFTGNTYAGVSFEWRCSPSSMELYWKDTPKEAFSCEFFKKFKNTFFYRIPLDGCPYSLVTEIAILTIKIYKKMPLIFISTASLSLLHVFLLSQGAWSNKDSNIFADHNFLINIFTFLKMFFFQLFLQSISNSILRLISL